MFLWSSVGRVRAGTAGADCSSFTRPCFSWLQLEPANSPQAAGALRCHHLPGKVRPSSALPRSVTLSQTCHSVLGHPICTFCDFMLDPVRAWAKGLCHTHRSCRTNPGPGQAVGTSQVRRPGGKRFLNCLKLGTLQARKIRVRLQRNDRRGIFL